jgi:hypothetical protein
MKQKPKKNSRHRRDFGPNGRLERAWIMIACASVPLSGYCRRRTIFAFIFQSQHHFKGVRTLLHYSNEAELGSAQWN